MTLIRIAGVAAVWFALAALGQAQIKLALASERANYLLFEPAHFIVEISNETNEPMEFTSDPEKAKSWLSFLILRPDGSRIKAEAEFFAKDRSLPPGEKISLRVNVTPLYSVRETGQYTIQAVVKPDNQPSFITSKLVYNVGRGVEIWKREKMVDGRRVVYSLISFMEEETNCYIRVEEPEENTVLATTRLGVILADSRPTCIFDENGELHILQSLKVRSFRYTRVTEDGRVISQEDRVVGSTVPALAHVPGGGVEFAGGMTKQEAERPKLSVDQQGPSLGTADRPFTAPPGYQPLPRK